MSGARYVPTDPRPAAGAGRRPETTRADPGVPSPVDAWRSRANQGDVEAQYRLAQMYSSGEGVPRSLVDAGRWYLQAAKRGHEMSAYKLAFFYLRGHMSSHREYVEAHKWFSLSAERGVGDAAEWRDKIAKKMTREELALSESLARDWRPES